jgi:serine/threonine protein kinase
MQLAVENICGLLIRSRLLSVDAVKDMYARWQTDSKDAVANTEKFTQWLVAKQYVTEYQAALLLRGRADQFFLNDYKILDRLGQGRMASVFKAAHQLGQVVAIKVLPPSMARDPQLLARFQREARLATRLKHPNVVRAFQVGEANGIHYLVMEYLQGETLDQVLKRRSRLPAPEGVRLIHQALLGLQHMHEKGLVHRDLKPANLMLVAASGRGADSTLNATVKILDIGLGRALIDDKAVEDVNKDRLTTEGAVMGTPDYLAPEQARDARSSDIRSDIYSLGCVLYQLLAGQVPFPDTNIINQMIRHATEAPRRLRELNPDIPDGLQQIVDWMMAKDPAQRYPTPERAAKALEVFLAAGAEAPADAQPEAGMRPYLHWLQTTDQSQQPGTAPTAELVGAGSGVVERPLKPLPVSGKGAHSRPHKARRKHRGATAVPPSPLQPNTDKSPDVIPPWDVELVPALPWQDIAFSLGRLALSRRDLLMLGIGAGSIAAAGLIGMAVSQLTGRKPKSAPRDKPENEAAPTDSNKAAAGNDGGSPAP